MLESNQIHINGRFLSQPNTGIQKYAFAMSLELSKIGFEVVFLCQKKDNNPAHFGKCKEFGQFNGHLWEQIDLPLYLRKNKVDLLINFGNTAPLLFRKNIITIHDLSIYEDPKWFSSFFRSYYQFLIPRLVKKAKQITTVSQFSKQAIIQRFPSSKSKITVLYNGIFFREQEKPSNIDFEYILYVGSINKRKNIDTLIHAFESINHPDLKLVLVGKQNSIYRTEAYTSKSNIIMMSDVDDGELQHLYRHAELFVFPSFYEGFGLPILEALNHNCPVICSDIQVFKELFGDNVVYCNPNSTEDLANTIRNFLLNPVKPNNIEELMLKYNYAQGAKKMKALIESIR